MNVYEAVIILNSEIIDNAKYVLYEELKLLEESISYIRVEDWGEKKLAYSIRSYTKGYYFVITFACENEDIVNQLNFNLQRLQDSDFVYVLKYIVLKQGFKIQKENILSNVLEKEFKILQVNKEVENKVSEKFICSECEKEIEKENFYKYVWAKIDNENRNRLILIAENVCDKCLNNILKEKNIHETAVFYYDIEELVEIYYNGENYYYYNYDDAQDDYFYQCEHCGEWLNESCDDYIHIDGTYFCCGDCAYEEGYRQCNDCGEWIYIDDIYSLENGDYICSNCYEDNYFTCENCGSIHYNDDACYVEDDDIYVCQNCYNEIYENTKRKNHLCNYHHYKSNYWTNRTTSDDVLNANLFGIELEVENVKCLISRNEIVQKICDIDNDEIFVFEEDGSLDNGIEIISNPCSINYWYTKENVLRNMFERLVNLGCKSHDVSTCGLHIHFSRDYVDTATISRILYLFEKFKNHLVMFSRRKIDSLNRWASFMNVDVKDLSLDYVKSNHDNCNRYRAVNLTNNKTIEIRIFKGTLKFESFMACIELVNNIVEMAKNMNDNEIINVESFYNVIEYQKTKYLKQYCLDRRIVENVNNIECEG